MGPNSSSALLYIIMMTNAIIILEIWGGVLVLVQKEFGKLQKEIRTIRL